MVWATLVIASFFLLMSDVKATLEEEEAVSNVAQTVPVS